jgi:nicotinamide-nucleotide amidase
MIAEILSTGDEVCHGIVVNSNAAHIASALSEPGIRVVRHTCVGDDLKALVSTLREIAQRADIAVVTGGLGPTMDDLTAEAAARAAGVALREHAEALEGILAFFKRFSRPLSPSDHKQALLPEGAIPLPNQWGTAPGFIMILGRCCFYFLPGVPMEMARMLSASVMPDILSRGGGIGQVLRTRLVSVFGLPEAVVNDRLKDFGKQYPDVRIGTMARFPAIYVKVSAIGPPASDLDERLERAHAWVMDQLGERVFSSTGQTMEEAVGKLLSQKRATLALAESCTGGLISDWITNVAGSSDYFLLSAVTYENAAKINLLGVSSDIITEFGAVSEETARQMASGARRISGADYALSVTGIAGPSGGSREKPVGTVCIGLAGPGKLISRKFQSPFSDRLYNKQIFAMVALDLLRRELMMDNAARVDSGQDPGSGK